MRGNMVGEQFFTHAGCNLNIDTIMANKTFTDPMSTTFSDLGLSQPLLDSLSQNGYTEPTPIQQRMIPQVLAGHDVVGQA